MKRLIAGIVFVAVVLMSGSALAAPGMQQDKANMNGLWNMSGTWEGGGSWNETWSFRQFGPFLLIETSEPAPGVGISLGSFVVLQLRLGCWPIYIGNSDGKTVQGFGYATQGNGTTSWSGIRTKAGMRRPAASTGSSTQP
jgi:hypothetical protein